MTDINRDPLLQQAYAVCVAIERCGVGSELANAATLASQLLRDLDARIISENLENHVRSGHPVEAEVRDLGQALRDWNQAPNPLTALGHEYAVGQAAARLARRLLPSEAGEIAVACDAEGRCVAVTRNDDHGRALQVYWKAEVSV
jgi:hypothetical protein